MSVYSSIINGSILKSLFSHANIRVFAIPVSTAFIGCFQLIISGYPQGHDWLYELVRIIEYREALVSDQGIPFWAGNLYHGFGSPIFIFYAPLYAASSALLMLSGMSVTTAAITVLVFFAMVASIGMAGLTRELIGRDNPGAESAARIAAAALVLAPYFLADILIRNASAEFVALCLAPYPLWGMALFYRGDRRGLPVVTLTFALVILSHNLTALVMAVSLFITAIFCFLSQRQISKFISAIIAMLISLGLSAWFWLPALGLRRYVRIDEMLLGKFDFHNNFNAVFEMFSYGSSFSIGWFPPFILFLCIAVFVNGNRNKFLMALVCAGFILIFLQTAASTLIWENIPFFPLFQFPWRLMGPLSIITALLVGLLFNIFFSNLRFAETLVIILIAVNAIPTLHRYSPLSIEYKSLILTPISIKERGLSATVGDEYLPRTAMKQLNDEAPPSEVIIRTNDKIEEVTPVHFSNYQIQLETTSRGQGEIHLARWYFPGWRVTVNGKNQLVFPDDKGAILVSIPEGKQQVNLWLSQPDLRKLGFIISGISLAISILMLVRWRFADDSRDKEASIL